MTTTPTTTEPLDPTRLSSDQWERAWWLAPALAALQEVRTEMAQGFTELRTAVQALSGEGAETRSMGEAALAMLQLLNEKYTALQASTQALQASADTLMAQFTAAGQEASEQAQTVQAVTADLNMEQQRIADALAALQPAAPAPEPTPTPEPAPAAPPNA